METYHSATEGQEGKHDEPYVQPGDSIAVQRKNSRTDSVGHSSVQPWSAGVFFPVVLGLVEHYSDAGELRYTSHVVIFGGREEHYATRADAEKVAAWLVRDVAGRARWTERGALHRKYSLGGI